MPSSRGAMTSLTFFTASRTPLPPKRLGSPSRSSTASCSPVDAPLGTAARPLAPLDSETSASTVGLPRLSRISRARTEMIVLIVAPTLRDRGRRVNAAAQRGDRVVGALAQRFPVLQGQTGRRDRLPHHDSDRRRAQPPGALRQNAERVVHVDRD